MTTRLHLQYPEAARLLAATAGSAAPGALLKLILATADELGIRDERMLTAINEFQRGPVSPEIAAGTRACRDELDERSWQLLEAADDGDELASEYSATFRRARVANALEFLLDAEPDESLYELIAAMDEDEERVISLLQDALTTHPSLNPGEPY